MAKDTRARVLQATSELMRRNGYAATSLKDISLASDATFSSLYFHFPGGKEQIAAEAVAASAELFLDYLGAELPNCVTFEQVVRTYFAPSLPALETSDYQPGCPVGTPANDAPDTATSLLSVCETALSNFASIVERHLHRLGHTPEQSRAFSTLIVSANEGSVLIARTARSRSPIQAALDALLTLSNTPP
jgi:AcrR family transcriptional regulator